VQHCTPEQLALAALREPLPAEDAAHLAECARCRHEVASLQRSVDVLAVPELAAPGASIEPPARVWAAIAAATEVSGAASAGLGAADATEPAPEPPAEPTEEPTADVVPLRRRRRPVLLVAAAAVAGALIGAGAVAVLRGGDDGVPVTSVTLAPLDRADASGSAVVVKKDDGTRLLRLDLRAPTLQHAYYEAWLLQPDVKGMVPLGMVDAGETDFVLPPGLDLGRFPVVDVSIEPLDGNPAHSGDSVARGELKS
jgi:hypothetical protein